MNSEIANRLVELRRAHGYSQEELAGRLGVSRQAISKWERAESSPDTANLIALARLYGISLAGLLLHTPPGGAVTLSAVFYELFCCIQVSDTGPGVPEGEQARIFGRFYRGEEVRDQEGLGLGLFLTRSILTREGGYVKLSSKPGKGSTFSLYLPLE